MSTENDEVVTPDINGYGADSIQVLEGLEAVRYRRKRAASPGI